MSNMRQIIEERLQALEPEFFDFEDESHLHAGHAGNKSCLIIRCRWTRPIFSNALLTTNIA